MLNAALFVLALTATTPTPATDIKKAEADVADAEKRFNAAYLANDMSAYWPFYDPSLTMWLGEDRGTLASYQAQWTKLLKDGGKVLENSMTDLVVRVGPSADTAVASYVVHVVTRQPDGSVTRENARETDVWFKHDGAWRVGHLHYAPKPEAPGAKP
jgi:ketosteroid isomerase-like protein